MTKDECKALRRVLRMLDAAGGGISLPTPPDSGLVSWSANIEVAIRWLIRNDPPTKSTQDMIREERARIARDAAFAQTPEGQASRAETEALRAEAREALAAWSQEKMHYDIETLVQHVIAERGATP